MVGAGLLAEASYHRDMVNEGWMRVRFFADARDGSRSRGAAGSQRKPRQTLWQFRHQLRLEMWLKT
jgi:hypothetical protein